MDVPRENRSVLADNISSDRSELIKELDDLNSQITDADLPPTPGAADAYISLVNAWQDAENVNVVMVTPETVQSIGRVGAGIKVGAAVNSYRPQPRAANSIDDYHQRTGRYYDDSDDEPGVTVNELEEKIDATYNKLCSLETTTTDAIEAIHQINGQLDNVSRNSITSVKQSRAIGAVLEQIASDIRGLNLRFEILNSEVKNIKESISVQKHTDSYKPYEIKKY